MRRKIAAVLLSALLACSMLAGCSGGSPSSSTPSSSKPSGGASSNSSNASSISQPSNSDSSSSSSTPSSSSASSITMDSTISKIQFENFTYYTITFSDNTYRTYYCFTISNPNKDKDLSFASINFIAKNSNGEILSLTGYNDILPPIAAGDTVILGGSFSHDEKFSTLTYTTDYSNCSVTNHNETNFPKQSDFTIHDIQYVSPTPASSFYSGWVKNNSSTDADITVNVRLFYKKDGKLFAGNSTFLYRVGYSYFSIHSEPILPPANYDSCIIIPCVVDIFY